MKTNKEMRKQIQNRDTPWMQFTVLPLAEVLAAMNEPTELLLDIVI